MSRGNRILGKQRSRWYSSGATCSGYGSYAKRTEPSGSITRDKYPEHLRSRQTLMTNSLPWGLCLRLLLFIHTMMKSLCLCNICPLDHYSFPGLHVLSNTTCIPIQDL